MEKSLTDTYSGHSSIKFIGFQNQQQMPAVYNSCDVFVLPSKGPNETWGLALNEAMAAGKAVVGSDKCGGSYDLILSNKNGFIINSDDSSSITTVLTFFTENKSAAVKMGASSLEIITSYSFLEGSNAIEKTLHLMEKKNIT